MSIFTQHDKNMRSLIFPPIVRHGVESEQLPDDYDSRVVYRALSDSDKSDEYENRSDVGMLAPALDEFDAHNEYNKAEFAIFQNDQRVEQLEDVKTEIQINWNGEKTVDELKAAGLGLESFFYTRPSSQTTLSQCIESINAKQGLLIGAGIAAVAGVIWKIWTMIKARSGKGGGSKSAEKLVENNVNEATKRLQKIKFDKNKVIKTDDVIKMLQDMRYVSTKDGTEESANDNKDAVIESVRSKNTHTCDDVLKLVVRNALGKYGFLARWLSRLVNNPQELRRINSACELMIKNYTELMELSVHINKELQECLDGGKPEVNALNLYTKKKDELTKKFDRFKSEIDDYSTRATTHGDSYKGPDADNKTIEKLVSVITHDKFHNIVENMQRITPLDNDKTKSVEEQNEKFREKPDAQKVQKIAEEHKDFYKQAHAILKDIMVMLVNHMNVLRVYGNCRLIISDTYNQYSKALEKAYELSLRSNSSSSDDGEK